MKWMRGNRSDLMPRLRGYGGSIPDTKVRIQKWAHKKYMIEVFDGDTKRTTHFGPYESLRLAKAAFLFAEPHNPLWES